MIIIIILLAIAVLFFGVMLYRAANVITTYKFTFEIIQTRVDLALTKLKQIDHLDAFEKDDEVGIFIKELRNVYSEINKVIK